MKKKFIIAVIFSMVSLWGCSDNRSVSVDSGKAFEEQEEKEQESQEEYDQEVKSQGNEKEVENKQKKIQEDIEKQKNETEDNIKASSGKATEIEKKDTKEDKAAQMPQSDLPPHDKADPSDFNGLWDDTYSQRCHIEIVCENDTYYDIRIDWGSSAWDNLHWEFTGEYDEEQGVLVYQDGHQYFQHYPDDGEMEQTEVYSNGEGVLYIRNGKLYWVDKTEDMGADGVFVKSGESGTEWADTYVVPDADIKYIAKELLESLSDEELRIARNEIFARHGRMFQDAELQAYFDSKPWYTAQYTPEEFTEVQDTILNDYEKTNLQTIQEVEADRQ